jgi:carbonic anhydrase
MDEVLERLKDGIRRFRRDVYPDQAEQYLRVMSEPQNPHALIITCADSRIHPDALTQAAPGDIFVTRNIGNMVPAYGEMLGGVSAVLEFAVSAMKVEHIVVCGHSDCGAMKGLLEPETVTSMPTVQAWLRNAAAALEVAKAIQEAELAAGGKPDLLKIVTEQNVLLQMQHVRTHPAVAGALAKGTLSVSGWVYDIAHGEVRICEGETHAFELLV